VLLVRRTREVGDNNLREAYMLRAFAFATISVTAVALSVSAYAQKADYGTPAEARAMLDKAVAALKADKTKALAAFSKGADGFKDRDLYVACAGTDGKVSSHLDATRIGMDRNTMKDSAGKEYGKEIQGKAQEGKVVEVAYMFPRPGADKTPVQKIAYVTKVGDQVCLVGYYK
jgi:hypothetical protein